MRDENKKKFNHIYDLLMEINQSNLDDGDEDAKGFSCYLLEIMDSMGEHYD